VEYQRSDSNGLDWMKNACERDVLWKLTGCDFDYRSLPWDVTHFKEYQDIKEMIQREFGVPEERTAVLLPAGSFLFADEGADAAVTLSWILYTLVEVIFEKQRALLRKCRWCEKYFLHETLKQKKFCSDPCRYDYHNKGKMLD